MRYLLIPLVCLGLLSICTSADASALGLLTTDSTTVNHLEDQDYEMIIKDGGTAGVLDVGDQVLGILEIQRVRDFLPVTSLFRQPGIGYPLDSFTAAFLVEVGMKWAPADIGNPNPGLYTFAFVPVSGGSADWTALGLSGLDTPTSAGTVAMIYDDSSQPFINPDAATLNLAVGTATDGDLLWEMGFAGVPGEGWFSVSSFDSGTPPSGTPIFVFGGALTELAMYNGAPHLLPHDALGTGFMNDMQFTGGLEAYTPNHFTLGSDTDFYIKPTPEPGSLALLGLGLMACGGLVYRRRNKARA